MSVPQETGPTLGVGTVDGQAWGGVKGCQKGPCGVPAPVSVGSVATSAGEGLLSFIFGALPHALDAFGMWDIGCCDGKQKAERAGISA